MLQKRSENRLGVGEYSPSLDKYCGALDFRTDFIQFYGSQLNDSYRDYIT